MTRIGTTVIEQRKTSRTGDEILFFLEALTHHLYYMQETDDDIFITAPKSYEKLSKKPGAAAKQKETIARLTKPFKKLSGSKRSSKSKNNLKDNEKGLDIFFGCQKRC